MSINMDGNDGPTYADFEYQHLDVRLDNPSDSELGRGDAGDFEVLFNPVDQQGLENDELAELVHMYRHVHVAPDDYAASGSQEPGDFEFRGAFGVNVTSGDELQPPTLSASDDVSTKVADTTVDGNGFGGNISNILAVYEQTDPGVIDHWDVNASVMFNDTVNGTGGGAGYKNHEERELNLRDAFGRGPVVDANDSLGVAGGIVNNESAQTAVEGIYKLTLVWDIHTVEGQRRQFALP